MTVATRRGKTSVYEIHQDGILWGTAHGTPKGRANEYIFLDAAGRTIRFQSERSGLIRVKPYDKVVTVIATHTDAPRNLAHIAKVHIKEGNWQSPEIAKAAAEQAAIERTARQHAAIKEKRDRFAVEARKAIRPLAGTLTPEGEAQLIDGIIEAMEWAQSQ
jgi:hypothetical protein